jgi:hypothetical protein
LRGRSPRDRPLVLEALEDRCLLSSYNFKLIAETGPQYSGLNVGQAINDLGDVAYEGDLQSGGAGIFVRNDDGTFKIIAITSDVIKTFVLSPYMNDSGTVSFGADLTDGARGIFTGDGGNLTRIADTEPYSPFSSIPMFPAPRVHYDGTVDFTANLTSGGKGFFVGNGGLPSILYVTGGQFSEFPGSGARQHHGDTVPFRATLQDGTRGAFTGTGGPTTTIATTDTMEGKFSSFIGVENNDEGEVFFSANLTAGGQIIVTVKDSTLTPFVDTSGPFSQFFAGQVSLNNEGLIVFAADLTAGGTGMFDGTDPVANKIIATGDELFDSTVASFPGINPKGLNNAGQIVFRADLADGRRVLVRADPDGAGPAGGRRPGKFEAFINLSGQDVSPSLVTTTQELNRAGPAAAAKPDDASSQLVFLGSLQGIQSQTTQLNYALKIARGPSDLLDHLFADLADSLFDHAF